MNNKPDWAWWAGRDDEWMTVGPCQTKEDAIAEFIDDQGVGEGDGVVLEAAMATLGLDASSILDAAYEHWSDSSDFFSSEYGDAPEPKGSKENQKAAEVEFRHCLMRGSTSGGIRSRRRTCSAPRATWRRLATRSIPTCCPAATIIRESQHDPHPAPRRARGRLDTVDRRRVSGGRCRSSCTATWRQGRTTTLGASAGLATLYATPV